MKKIIAFLILFFSFGLLERFFPLKPGQKVFREGFRTDAVHFFVNEFFIKIGIFLLIFPLILISRKLFPNFPDFAANLHPFFAFLMAVLIADVAGYWAHRLHHEIPFLWKLHSVHHSSPKMDWLASARTHPLNVIINRIFGALPLLLLGFSKETFGAYLVFIGLWALFIHSNVRFRLRPIHFLFATPMFHHWHHSNDPEARNKNYAGQFPWVDWLFGTLHLPDRWPETYGITEEMPEGYIKQLKYPFAKEGFSEQVQE